MQIEASPETLPMDDGAATRTVCVSTQQRKSVYALVGVAVGISALFFLLSQPGLEERKLIGTWRMHYELTDEYDLIQFEANHRVTRFEPSVGEFFHEGAYWRVVDGGLVIDQSRHGRGIVAKVVDFWNTGTTKVGRQNPSVFRMTWHATGSLTLTELDGPIGRPAKLGLERVRDFDPAVWDERGMPMPAEPAQLR